MVKIDICVGSACHVCGGQKVLQAFLSILDRNQLRRQVTLCGSLCQGQCAQGVVVKINEAETLIIKPDQVYEVFTKKIVPLLPQGR